jgi:hypothetical protein
MYKNFIIFSFLLFILYNCQINNDISDPYDYEKDTPTWLKSKIDTISNSTNFYFGTKVYRYTYERSYIYYIMVPLSSCVYCELYNQNGDKIHFRNDDEFEDFINKRRNEVLIWEWEIKP